MSASTLQNPISSIPPRKVPRYHGIDNLRWCLIILVVSMHAAVTCSGFGSWYDKEPAPHSEPVLFFFAAYQSYLQAFFMALLFFLAGYFVPGAYDRKGPGRFLRDRGYRLGLPVLFYMFVLSPITEYLANRAWNLREARYFAREWVAHVLHGHFLSDSGPLWFCLALLIFCAVYAAYRVLSPSPRATGSGKPPSDGKLLVFIAIISATTFLVRLVQPNGTSFHNMQLANFSQYIAMFVAGLWTFREGWFEKLPFRTGMRWLMLALVPGFALWVAILMASGAFQGKANYLSGGWHWQGAALNCWESFVCVGISLGLLVLFRDRFNRQGRAEKFVSDNAFSVYVFHPPILVAITCLLHPIPMHVVVRFMCLTIAAVVTTYAASALVFRRIPGLRAIL